MRGGAFSMTTESVTGRGIPVGPQAGLLEEIVATLGRSPAWPQLR
jgi:hypothetical protein